jgi:hypothetical protein
MLYAWLCEHRPLYIRENLVFWHKLNGLNNRIYVLSTIDSAIVDACARAQFVVVAYVVCVIEVFFF